MRGLALARAGLSALGITIAAFAAGCGSSATVVRDQRLSLTITEYRLAPQNVSAGAGPLTIVIRNRGHRTHNLVIFRGSKTLANAAPVWPGQSSKLTVTVPAGRYVMASTILTDQSLGAYGTLVVR